MTSPEEKILHRNSFFKFAFTKLSREQQKNLIEMIKCAHYYRDKTLCLGKCLINISQKLKSIYMATLVFIFRHIIHGNYVRIICRYKQTITIICCFQK